MDQSGERNYIESLVCDWWTKLRLGWAPASVQLYGSAAYSLQKTFAWAEKLNKQNSYELFQIQKMWDKSSAVNPRPMILLNLTMTIMMNPSLLKLLMLQRVVIAVNPCLFVQVI